VLKLGFDRFHLSKRAHSFIKLRFDSFNAVTWLIEYRVQETVSSITDFIPKYPRKKKVRSEKKKKKKKKEKKKNT
jgi:hypothetical protein